MLSQAQLARRIRSHVGAQMYDESAVAPIGIAIYSLSGPRDIREVRYVGQSADPRRRFLQHLNAAKLWLPDERPWWVKSPKLRPFHRRQRIFGQLPGRVLPLGERGYRRRPRGLGLPCVDGLGGTRHIVAALDVRHRGLRRVTRVD
jgi:hypothetical protein